MGNGKPVFNQDAGRAFILSPPLAVAQTIRFPMIRGIRPVFRINYVRQFVEVAIALLFTFGLTFMLRKRGSDQSEARAAGRTGGQNSPQTRHSPKRSRSASVETSPRCRC